MNTRYPGTNEAQAVAPRRSYSAPRLIQYGSLVMVTQSIKAGQMTDPGPGGGGKTA